jgi:hypothetical protein
MGLQKLNTIAMRLSSTTFLPFIIVSLLLTGARAAVAESATEQLCEPDPFWAALETSEIDNQLSPKTDGPVDIHVGLFVNELREINAVGDTFRLLGTISATWCDSRLAFDSQEEGRETRTYHGPAAEEKTNSIWTVQGFPTNQVGAVSATQRVLHLRSDGRVDATSNIDIRLAADYDLRRFPFDEQTLTVGLESYAWDANQTLLIADDETTGFSDKFVMPEWRLVRVFADTMITEVARSDEPFSRFVLSIEIERKSGFYLWKVLLPLLIIVALSWSVFWMNDEKFAVRVRTSATGILTIVAYQFMAAKDLPRVAYLTLIDKIMVASFILLAITVVQSLVVSRCSDPEVGRRIDRIARWLFPLAYVGLIALVVAASMI